MPFMIGSFASRLGGKRESGVLRHVLDLPVSEPSVHRQRLLRLLLSVAGLFWAAPLLPATATLSINTGTTVGSFVPLQVFGNNIGYWDGPGGLNAIQSRLQQISAQFFRFPGGSSSDDYHWNGTGAFDANSHWIPDDTQYTPGWLGIETWRGTTSASYGNASNLTDGDTGTGWLSNADTDTPAAQWAYVDLGSSKTADRVAITWGVPYATQFQVQYWTGTAWPAPYAAASNQWAVCSSGTLTGTGGTQTVVFSPVNAEFYRILCQSSSVTPPQYGINEITVSYGTTQLSVNTDSESAQSPATVSSTDPACAPDETVQLDFVTFMTWLKAYSPEAKPLITVNIGTGTPQEAAAWVHYANVVMGYGIKDWEIGNETEGDWETGGPLNANDYGRRYAEYYAAMKAVDSSIHIYGPVTGGPYEASNNFDGLTYIQGWVNRLAADPSGNLAAEAEGVDYHWYPEYGTSSTEAASLATPAALAQFLGTDLPAMLANHPHPTTVPVLMTEFNSGINAPLEVHLSSGLWLADVLTTFAATVGTRGSAFLWEALEAGSADTSTSGDSLGMLNGTSDAYEYQPRAQYWAEQMLSMDWAIPGDAAAHTLVQTSSSVPTLLTCTADLRPDGVLSVVVINKDPSNTYTAQVNLSGFTPASSAARWVLDSSCYAWDTADGNPYHANPDSGPAAGTETGVAGTFTHAFGPYSLTVFQFLPLGMTPGTATPTSTPPPTATASPTPAPLGMIDDFEELSRNGISPYRLDLMNGGWSVSLCTGATSSVSYTFPGAAGSVYGCAWSLTVPASGWADLFAAFSGSYSAAGAGYVGLEFWAYGDGKPWRAMITTQAVTDYDNYGIDFTPPAGRWSFVRIPFTSMTRQGWGAQSPAPPSTPTATDITGVEFSCQSTGALRLGLDQICFYQDAVLSWTPTISPTYSPSPTASSTPSVTPTPTPSCSFSPSPTITPTRSASPTASVTPTASPSPSITPTATATPVSSGPPTVLKVLSLPNPVTRSGPVDLALQLAGSADSLDVRIYSRALIRVYAGTIRSSAYAGAGWKSLLLPSEAFPSNGLYFVEVRGSVGSATSSWTTGSVYVDRP